MKQTLVKGSSINAYSKTCLQHLHIFDYSQRTVLALESTNMHYTVTSCIKSSFKVIAISQSE